MTHDYTYLSHLDSVELLDRAYRGNWTGPEAHMIRALADRLDQYLDVQAVVLRLEDELADAVRRADSWREEAQAVQRQLDQVRG
jgi:hypothetical protein